MPSKVIFRTFLLQILLYFGGLFFFINFHSCAPKIKTKYLVYLTDNTCRKNSKLETITKVIDTVLYDIFTKNIRKVIFFKQSFLLAKNNDTLFFVSLTNTGLRMDSSIIRNNEDFFLLNDSLYIYNAINKTLITSNGQFAAKKIHSLKDFKEYEAVGLGKTLLVNFNNKFGLINNFQVWKTRQINHFDKAPFLLIIDSIKNKIGVYPRDFYETKTRYEETLFDMDSLNHIFFTHAGSEKVSKISITNDLLVQTELHNNPIRKPFLKKDKQDLVKIRDYEYLNEKNIDLKVIDNKYVVILKRLANEKPLTPLRFKLFVFNANLEKIHCEEIKMEIIPKIIKYNRGFFLFFKNEKKYNNYELF